ncbi:MAG TPA: tyrosine-type recombinase/integrase [Steroidobacteraceae bacterium]|jgi:integrase
MSPPVWQRFESILADPINRYLALKRSMGCRFNTEDRALRVFDQFLTDRGVSSVGDIDAALLDAFLASRRRSARSYNNLLGVVRRLLDWMVDQQELAVSPLQSRPRREGTRRLPFLYDEATIRRILKCAAELPDGTRAPQRGATYATIFAILAALGLRVGEVSRLQCGDVDLQREVLLVRNSKFGKSRLVPFGPRLAARGSTALVCRTSRAAAWRGRP